jgi:hypothetical protein
MQRAQEKKNVSLGSKRAADFMAGGDRSTPENGRRGRRPWLLPGPIAEIKSLKDGH